MTTDYTLERGFFGRRLVLTNAWNPSYADFMQQENIRELYLNYARGWSGDNLNFLRSLPFLEAFSILDLRIENVTPVMGLPSLRAIEISTYCKTPLDFSCWPTLENCALYWRRGAESLFSKDLMTTLFLHRYDDSRSEAFTALAALTELSVANSALREVEAIGSLRHLVSLGLYNLKALESLSGLERLAQIQKLAVNGCKRVETVDEIASLTNLRTLELNDDGAIASLEPLRSLAELENLSFYESTNVRDGRLDVLGDLPKLQTIAMQNRKHYNRRREEISASFLNHTKQQQRT